VKELSYKIKPVLSTTTSTTGRPTVYPTAAPTAVHLDAEKVKFRIFSSAKISYYRTVQRDGFGQKMVSIDRTLLKGEAPRISADLDAEKVEYNFASSLNTLYIAESTQFYSAFSPISLTTRFRRKREV
jgi:hypothetical protein